MSTRATGILDRDPFHVCGEGPGKRNIGGCRSAGMRENVQRLDRGRRSGWILPYPPVHIDPSPPGELDLAGLCIVIRFSSRRRGGFISTRQSSPIWTICSPQSPNVRTILRTKSRCRGRRVQRSTPSPPCGSKTPKWQFFWCPRLRPGKWLWSETDVDASLDRARLIGVDRVEMHGSACPARETWDCNLSRSSNWKALRRWSVLRGRLACR